MKVLFYPSNKLPSGIRVARFIQPTGTVEDFDVGIYWPLWGVINKPDDFVISQAVKGKPFINWQLNNCTKFAVDQYFTTAFGYSSLIQPGFNGYCVAKPSLHGGWQIKYPEEAPDNTDVAMGDRKYIICQKEINIYKEGVGLTEFRVFVFGKNIFIVERRKRKNQKFISVATKFILHRDSTKIFSPDELYKIFKFCRVSGLDFGEIDILRDWDTGFLYIVDINNIAGGVKIFKNKEIDQLYKKYFFQLCEQYKFYRQS